VNDATRLGLGQRLRVRFGREFDARFRTKSTSMLFASLAAALIVVAGNTAYAAPKPIAAVLIRVDSAHDPETGFYVHVHFRIPTLKANQKYSCEISVFSKAKSGKPATLITKWNYQSAGFPPRPTGENMAEANVRPVDVPNLGSATLKCVVGL